MGQRARKYRGSVPCKFLLDEVVDKWPVRKLMPAAKLVCSTDYAVRQYNKKNTPFYHNDEAFRKAMRRCIAMNAFDHVDTIIRVLDLEEEYQLSLMDDNEEPEIE